MFCSYSLKVSQEMENSRKQAEGPEQQLFLDFVFISRKRSKTHSGNCAGCKCSRDNACTNVCYVYKWHCIIHIKICFWRDIPDTAEISRGDAWQPFAYLGGCSLEKCAPGDGGLQNTARRTVAAAAICRPCCIYINQRFTNSALGAKRGNTEHAENA